MNISKEIIRKELIDIRYFLAREKSFSILGDYYKVMNSKVERYNNAMKDADSRLCDVYAILYLDNNSQESASDILGVSVSTISRINSRIIEHIYTKFNKAV